MNFAERILNLREKLPSANLDALLITHLPNIFYLTGFTGSAAVLIVSPRRTLFLTDGRYAEQAARQVKNVPVQLSTKGLLADAATKIRRSRAGRVGFETRHLAHESYARLKMDLRGCAHLIPCLDWVEVLRSIKSGEEVRRIQASLKIVTQAFEEILPLVRPGVRERELSAELEYRMKQRGAHKVSFDLIVASGARSALPHGVASEKRVCRNEFLVFDLGAILHGYSSDFTRTVYLGRPPARAREIYNVVRESQQRAIEGIYEGVTASQIDHWARDIITQHGYGSFFVHSTGHGIGIEVHEAPTLSRHSPTILKAGQVVTVEPGIYVPRYGGVRIEDIVVVGQQGCENLTPTTKDLIVL